MGKFFGGVDESVSRDKRASILEARMRSLLEELSDIERDYARLKGEVESRELKKWELTDFAKVKLADTALLDETTVPFFKVEGKMFMRYDAIRLEQGEVGLDVVFISRGDDVVTMHTAARDAINAGSITLNDINGVMEVRVA